MCVEQYRTRFFFFIKVLWRQRDFWAEYQKYLLIWQCVHLEIQSADCYKVNKRKRKWSELYDVANTCEWEGRWVGEWNDLYRRRTSQLGQGGANAVLKNTLAHHLLYPTLILTCFSCFLCLPPGGKKNCCVPSPSTVAFSSSTEDQKARGLSTHGAGNKWGWKVQ